MTQRDPSQHLKFEFSATGSAAEMPHPEAKPWAVWEWAAPSFLRVVFILLKNSFFFF